MIDEKFLKEAFKGHEVPKGLKEATAHIVTVYGIKGISDPMYIANTIAKRTGKGDGEGNFWGWD